MLRHSTYLEVRLANIKHNIELIRTHYAPKASIIAMVKGDAYGNGLPRVSRYMHERCGINHFGVASLGEGLSILQKNAQTIGAGKDNRVIVFSDTELMDESLHHIYKDQNARHASGKGGALLSPVLGTRAQLKMFCAHRRTVFKDTPLLLKVNTGMNRLAMRPQELKEVVDMLKDSGGVDMLLQHFSMAGYVDHSFITKQYDAFQTARKILEDNGVEVRSTSCANSAAIEQQRAVDESFVRPGLMLYGPSSLSSKTILDADTERLRLWDGKPCGYFYTKVLHHFVVRAGGYVGYGITRNLVPEDAVIVLLPIGYADGFLRYYSNMPITVSPAPAAGSAEESAAEAAAGGGPDALIGHVHGNVNMDMTAVVVYPSKVGKDIDTIMRTIQDESRVLVWGHDIAAKSRVVKTIPWQLMCGLSDRVPRRHVE